MLIEIESNRYSRVKRAEALHILEQAKISPDRFVAHRDRTFTAKFERKRLDLFKSLDYEDRMELAAHHSVAIFKRPSQKIDRGPFITLRFGFVATDRLGLISSKPAENGNGAAHAHYDGDLAIMSHLIGLARDIKQLTQYAHELVQTENRREHILVTLDELQKQVGNMSESLGQLANAVFAQPA